MLSLSLLRSCSISFKKKIDVMVHDMNECLCISKSMIVYGFEIRKGKFPGFYNESPKLQSRMQKWIIFTRKAKLRY